MLTIYFCSRYVGVCWSF